MTDWISLALTYGGFTSLDRVYLSQVLSRLSDEEKRLFITPPPSVINAYFAELYDKEGPQAATQYFFELSKALNLFQDAPSFQERTPFIRLNLSGKSYGFCYENVDGVGLVFSEEEELVTGSLIFELAQIFPQYQMAQEEGLIKLFPLTYEGLKSEAVNLDHPRALLSSLHRLENGVLKLSSFNLEEILELAGHFPAQKVYYAYSQRQFVLYLIESR
ncbi:hypothetical protein ABID29_000688 [Streptococcus rupicaprae]|uniref:Cystathionine beta-lyase n=1 Tax=Streptococcus rupicaprae TaxID=759619 RepID=A0ABV2FGF9_9STRE